jgi:hypothetical protein
VAILTAVQASVPESMVKDQKAAMLGSAIAILLLDLENIKLDLGEEKFLQTCCHYPLQIKIAFANWRTISSQQDVELNERGYQMIHVPAGKNSADMKMTAIGASLFVPYPNVKEVLVGSSDKDLVHLCNTLRLHGLNIQAVRKQSGVLTVFNLITGQTIHYPQSPAPLLIPSMAECLQGIKALVQSEQAAHNPWVKLSGLSKKFQDTYGFTLSQLMSHYEPGKKARDLFGDRPTEFVMHQPGGQGEIYICLFASDSSNASNHAPIAKSLVCEDPQPTIIQPKIKSRQGLEKALLNTMKTLTPASKSNPVKITEFLSQFQKQQGQPVSYFLKALAINQKTVVFLKTCPAFNLELTDKIWQIELRKP